MEANASIFPFDYLFSSQPHVHGSFSKYGKLVLGIGGGGVGRHPLSGRQSLCT